MEISIFLNRVVHVMLNVWVKTVVELVIKRWSFLSDVDAGDVDGAVCEFFVYMISDFGSVYIGVR